MDLVSRLIRLICKTFMIIAVFVLAFKVSVILGLELCSFAFIMGITSYIYLPKIKNNQSEIKKRSDDYVRVATENISGIREIKSLGIKKNIEKDIKKRLDGLYDFEIKRRNYEIKYSFLNNTL